MALPWDETRKSAVGRLRLQAHPRLNDWECGGVRSRRMAARVIRASLEKEPPPIRDRRRLFHGPCRARCRSATVAHVVDGVVHRVPGLIDVPQRAMLQLA